MNPKIRTTMIAGAIAALLAGPTWAASDAPRVGAQPPAPANAELSQPLRDPSTTPRPMSETPQIGGTTYGAAASGASVGDNPLYTRSAAELDGVEVVDAAGDKVGTVKQIVLAPDRKSAHAIISTGGFLGMGASDIMVSLDRLEPLDDKLQMIVTEEEIAALKDEKPEADKYVEVKGDTPISESIVEFSAFERGADSQGPAAAPMTPQATPETPAAPR
ncbi:MAG TPA: PRC-barrel domain-containing protein [Azoarcus taiwanensis]|nr:PRC-barrel domain-containing protein [Azoarcus taiwanensis]